MPAPQPPKYQTIYDSLRRRILDGELAPGERLSPQQELAEEYGVTLMTLRQAVSALEAEGLVWAARGKGTFVSDRPIDIRVGNLSSFAQQMRAAGLELQTEVLDVGGIPPGTRPDVADALAVVGELCCVVRRRSVDGLPFGLQHSFLAPDLGVVEPGGTFEGESLYDSIADATGWTVAEARESITAVRLGPDQADLLRAEPGEPALLSIRTSISQHGRPFLYDEALLVGDRCTIVADRTAARLTIRYDVGTADRQIL